MKSIATYFGLLVLAGLASPSAAELPKLVETAFARAAAGSTGGWAYTRTSVEGRVTTVERYDPDAANGGWTLVAVDGKAPAAKQLRKYAERSERRETRDHPGDVDFADIVDVESIVLAAESPTSATYRFKPTPDAPASGDEEDFSAYLDGTMVIDKSGPAVEFLELTNGSPFSPAAGVKVTKMRLRMEFVTNADGRVAIRELSQSMAGRLFGLKRIHQATTVSFSEFVPQR